MWSPLYLWVLIKLTIVRTHFGCKSKPRAHGQNNDQDDKYMGNNFICACARASDCTYEQWAYWSLRQWNNCECAFRKTVNVSLSLFVLFACLSVEYWINIVHLDSPGWKIWFFCRNDIQQNHTRQMQFNILDSKQCFFFHVSFVFCGFGSLTILLFLIELCCCCSLELLSVCSDVHMTTNRFAKRAKR